MKKRLKDTELRACLKACRKAARDGEIAAHGRPVNISRIHKSKKVYDRKRIKAADKKSLSFLCPVVCSDSVAAWPVCCFD